MLCSARMPRRKCARITHEDRGLIVCKKCEGWTEVTIHRITLSSESCVLSSALPFGRPRSVCENGAPDVSSGRAGIDDSAAAGRPSANTSVLSVEGETDESFVSRAKGGSVFSQSRASSVRVRGGHGLRLTVPRRPSNRQQ